MKEITGFTPGPWIWESGFLISDDAEGTFILQTPWQGTSAHHFPIHCNPADRELIAAAPDLYAECQALRAQRDALVKALEILIDEADKARECLLSESLVGRFRYAARTRIAIDQAQAALRKFYGVE